MSSIKERNVVNDGGAVFFGLVVRWTLSTAFHAPHDHTMKEMASVVGLIGGAAVTRLFSKTETQFSMYCVGLAVGFFAHVAVSLIFWEGKVWAISSAGA